MPPVVRSQEHRIYITGRYADLVDRSREVLCRPSIMPMVEIMDMIQFLHHIGKIAFCDPIPGLVGVVVEIGDTVTDGHPGDRPVRRKEGGEDNDGGQEDAKTFYHNGWFGDGGKDKENPLLS